MIAWVVLHTNKHSGVQSVLYYALNKNHCKADFKITKEICFLRSQIRKNNDTFYTVFLFIFSYN